MAAECPDRAQRDWNSSYQWDLSYYDSCTEVDADAVGIGVVAAFIISASVLVLTVTAAFLWWSIPEILLNDVDRHLLSLIDARRTSSRFRPSKKNTPHRVDAVIHFLLSLADQQMVSAFALLIAAFAHWDSILIYAMVVTSSLTLLACAVYLPVTPIVAFRERQLSAQRATQ